MKRVKILALLGSFFYIQNSFSATVTVTNNSVHPITYSFYYNNRYYTPTYVRPGVSSTFNSGIHSIRGFSGALLVQIGQSFLMLLRCQSLLLV